MLSTLIKSKSRVKLLILFLTHPDERFYYSEVHRRLGIPHAALQKEFKALTAAGLLLTSKEAGIRYYWVNKYLSIYPELKSIVFKTVGLADFLRAELDEIGQIDVALIYGSVARNTEEARSDIDLLIVGNVDINAAYQAVANAEGTLSREINLSVFSMDEWAERVKKKQALPTDILRHPKIVLIGDESRLREPRDSRE